MKRIILIAAALSLALAACGGTETVGGGLKDRGTKGGRLEDQFRKKTPTAEPTRPGAIDNRSKKPSARPAVKQISVRFKIIPGGYDPYVIRTYVGAWIEVTNTDTKERTVTANENQPVAFNSGMIKPKAKWVFKVDKPGKFGFHDETTPFAVGTLEVYPR